MEKLISKLFESQIQSHIFHLRTNSYANHIALEEYYSSIVDEIDRLSESYKGKYGIIKFNESYNIKNDSDINDIVDYFESLAFYIDDKREIFNDGFIESIIDDISELVYTTLYKLKNLK